MITNLHIENFKSIENMDLPLGNLNILIGENGCGKTNILEAAAIGVAASQDKLDNEYLAARGIRKTDNKFMKSAFNAENAKKDINIFITAVLNNDTNEFKFNIAEEKGRLVGMRIPMEVLQDNEGEKNKLLQQFQEQTKQLENKISDELLNKMFTKIMEIMHNPLTFKPIFNSIIEIFFPYTNFLLYAPENTFLRKFEEEGQIQPLGVRGEGLFSHLLKITTEKPDLLLKIKENLRLLDWFEDFEIPSNLFATQRILKIKDRFLDENLPFFDQRSANEGFLLLLFYFTLFISDETPTFFAIDNIDTGLNPKLGSRLIEILAKLAKEHNKQAIITTHNPAILDGLDLRDDAQRLFVVSRNKEGKTKIKRILPVEGNSEEEPVPLSEQFLRGYIGGLPLNF